MMPRYPSVLQSFIVACAAALLASHAAAVTRAECERDYKPTVGQTGKDVVWVPTPYGIVSGMLGLAKVKPTDIVYDLGAGDGIIAITAGKLGATAVGIEYEPAMAKFAKCLVEAENMGEKVRIIEGDIFKEDFSKATVVTMYLLPELNRCIRHRLLAMPPGTRAVSHDFRMGEWEPDDTFEEGFRMAHLWIVPARVEGTWRVSDSIGTDVTVRLDAIVPERGRRGDRGCQEADARGREPARQRAQVHVQRRQGRHADIRGHRQRRHIEGNAAQRQRERRGHRQGRRRDPGRSVVADGTGVPASTTGASTPRGVASATPD